MNAMVDYSEAVDKAGGNAELAKDLFGMLLQELPQLSQLLKQAISRQDMTAMRDHAHKIYGSTAYCSVPQLREAASAMETCIKAMQIAGIHKQYDELEKAIAALLEQGPAHLEASW